MPRILIVNSDTAELDDRNRASGDPDAGEGYANALRACRNDLDITVISPYKGDPLPPLKGFDGVVFTGSGVDWNTSDPRAEPLAKAMRRVFDAGLPTLGSCNGMQLAACVLGGDCGASANGREDGLALDIELTEQGRAHPLLAGREDGFAAPCVHRDEVTVVPEGAVVLARNAHSAVQAMAYERDGIRFWGVQYHPEYPPDYVGRIVATKDHFDPARAQDLRRADRDRQAAARLGIGAEDLRDDVRLTELRNWLAAL